MNLVLTIVTRVVGEDAEGGGNSASDSASEFGVGFSSLSSDRLGAFSGGVLLGVGGLRLGLRVRGVLVGLGCFRLLRLASPWAAGRRGLLELLQLRSPGASPRTTSAAAKAGRSVTFFSA